jgi:Zn-dependent protease with chaperone function
MRILALLPILLFIAAPAPQPSAADTSAASLDAAVDMDGRIALTFTGPPSLAPSAIVDALAAVLHCDAGDFSVRPADAGREALEIDAACGHHVARTDDVFAANWNLAALSEPLRAAAVDRFDFSLVYPRLELSQVNPRLPLRERGGKQIYAASWPLDDAHEPGRVSLLYGFSSRDDLYRTAALAMLLLAAAIALVLAAARRTRGKPDRVAAWSGYRTLVSIVCTVGVLMWIGGVWPDFLPARLWLALGWAGVRRCVLVPALLLLPLVVGEIAIRQITRGVEARLKGSSLSRLETLGRSFLVLLSIAALFAFFFFVFDMPRDLSGRVQTIGSAAAVLSLVTVLVLLPRLIGIRSRAMPAGELRQRIETLAARHGVRFRRINVLSGRRADVPANAWVKKREVVTYTAPLLQQLSRSEVDAVTLAEIGRVKLRHVRIIGLTSLALVALILALPPLVTSTFAPAALPLIMLLLLSVRAYVLRRLCLARDRLCARLSDDPAALITALARIAGINGEPLSRPRWQIWLATHPAMTVRFRTIAAAAGLSEQQVLAAIAMADDERRDGYVFGTADPPSRSAALEPVMADAPWPV